MNESSSGSSESDTDLHEALRAVVPDAPIVVDEVLIEIESLGRVSRSDRQRRDDSVFLARFFGVCVFVIGLLTILPALYYWIVIRNEPGQPLSRWVWMIGFVGAIHVVYGIYTMQVIDYSSLLALSIFLLVVTCVYGFVGMVLILDENNGSLSRILQLPEVLKTRARIWCGIMFGISAISCYLFGRESMLWRRRQMAA